MKQFKGSLTIYRILLLFISIGIYFVGLLTENPKWIFYSIMFLWGGIVLYIIQNTSKRAALLIFQIAFFNFLLGGTFLNYITTGETLYYFSDSILIHTFSLIYISQFTLFLTYYYLTLIKTNKEITKNITSYNDLILFIRTASLIILLLTYIPYLLEIYEKINFVANNSYSEIYLRESSNLPGIIIKLAQCFQPAFFLYLATLPKKSNAKYIIALYLIAIMLSVFVGARADFARGVMVLFFYYLIRSNKRIIGKDKTWIGRKEILGLIIFIPLIIMFLYNIGQDRWDSNSNSTSSSVVSVVNEFLIEQGVSISVIHYAKYYEEDLPKNNYVSGPILKLFKENTLLKNYFEEEKYKKQSIESALYSDRFGDAISYLTMPHRYLLGHGMGSSYIAEVNHSAGYIGIVLINILYGAILYLTDKYFGKNVWISAILLLMLYRLIYSPRASTLEFISNSINLTYVGVFVGTYIFAKLLYNFKRRTIELK